MKPTDDATAIQRAVVLGEGDEFAAGDLDAPGSRQVDAAQDVLQRRLPAAGCAYDRDQLALLDEEVEPLQGHDLEVGDLVDLDEVLADDRVLIHRSPILRTLPKFARRAWMPTTTTVAATRTRSPRAATASEGHGMTIGAEPLPVKNARSRPGSIR
jgi:hypothetical protein